METKKKQCLLYAAGFDPGPIDGIDGPKTRAAMARVKNEYGCDEEGLIGIIAGTVAPLKSSFDILVETTLPSSGDAEQYLQADGCYHIPRGVDVQLTKNFRSREVECQGVGCCKETVISKRIMNTAQAIRDEIDEPLYITTAGGSGYRCPIHNADPRVGGAVNSLHMSGNAVDLHYRDPYRLKAVALHHVTNGEVGIYSWGCHVGEWDRGYLSQFKGN